MHIMEGTILRWGGSLALRIDAKEARRLGLEAGRKIHWSLMDDDEVDLGNPPTFTDHPDTAKNHDAMLYGG